MSLSASFSSALSGLTAAAKSAEIVSSNVANASTEGYGRREVELTNRRGGVAGAGVRIVGIDRIVNDGAIAQRRLAQADLGFNQQSASYFTQLEQVLGTPDEPDSINAKFVAFEASLITAASQPASQTNLIAVARTGSDLALHLNKASDQIRATREDADRQISILVGQVNDSLLLVEDLNRDISRMAARGLDIASLVDQRQLEIDKIAEIIPIQQAPRDLGKVALVTPNGNVLLDDHAAHFSFAGTTSITADMTLDSGALGDLGLEGAAASVGTARDAIAGGTLAAMFELRDVAAVKSQTQLDAYSRNLMDRMSDVAVDPTLTGGESGFFTDGNRAVFDPLDEPGLAGRITLNAAIDPETGNPALIRDGLNSAGSGPVGDPSLLIAMRDALNAQQIPATGGFLRAESAGQLLTTILSDIGSDRQNAETSVTFSTSQVNSLREIEAQSGVNTDEEMQKLLLIERAYAANARVIQTVDEMLDEILRL